MDKTSPKVTESLDALAKIHKSLSVRKQKDLLESFNIVKSQLLKHRQSFWSDEEKRTSTLANMRTSGLKRRFQYTLDWRDTGESVGPYDIEQSAELLSIKLTSLRTLIATARRDKRKVTFTRENALGAVDVVTLTKIEKPND